MTHAVPVCSTTLNERCVVRLPALSTHCLLQPLRCDKENREDAPTANVPTWALHRSIRYCVSARKVIADMPSTTRTASGRHEGTSVLSLKVVFGNAGALTCASFMAMCYCGNGGEEIRSLNMPGTAGTSSGKRGEA